MSKRNIGFIVLFFESILLFIITTLSIGKITLLNTSYVFKKLDSVDFYSKQYEEIKKEMSYYTNQSGFEDDILDNIFTINDVKKHQKMVINNLYQGRTTIIDTTMIKENFRKKIEQYIIDNNYQEVDEKEINDFVDKMASIYSDEIKFMNYIDKVKFIPKVSKLTTEAISISALLLIVLIIVNKKVLYRKNYPVLFYTNAFLLIYTNIYITNHIDIKNIYIYSDLISQVIKRVAHDLSKIAIIIPTIYLIIGLILSIFMKPNERIHKKS